METVSFKPASEFQEIAAKVFAEQSKRILARLPFAAVEHVGGTSIPNSLTKGDLDVNVRVQKEGFETAKNALREMYEINQPDNWTDGFASFKDNSVGMDFGVQLTVIGSPDDVFIAQRDALLASPELVEELNALKWRYEGKSMDEYREAKGEFFNKQ